MGITERHWFEDEEPELTEQQLEDIVAENQRNYKKGYADAMKNAVPLDKLCEWLAEHHTFYSYFVMDRFAWRKVLTEWMEGEKHG